MYTHYSLIKGLIIKDNEGKTEFKENFNLNDEKIEELLDKIIPLENKEFFITKNRFKILCETPITIIENISKDNLIETLKNKFYVMNDNINERLLEKYNIKKIKINKCKVYEIKIPNCIEEIQFERCLIEKLIIPKTIKKCCFNLTYPKKLIFQGDLDELETNYLIELPNVKKLILNCYCKYNIDFLLNSIIDLKIVNYSEYTDNILIDNLPNSVKKLEIYGVKNPNIPPFIESLKMTLFEKAIIPTTIKKLNCEMMKNEELIFLDEEYNFEEVNIINCKKIVNLPKNLKIVNNEIHFP